MVRLHSQRAHVESVRHQLRAVGEEVEVCDVVEENEVAEGNERTVKIRNVLKWVRQTPALTRGRRARQQHVRMHSHVIMRKSHFTSTERYLKTFIETSP